MEDVRRRFGGMSFSGVPMNEMSEVERKIAEMKVCSFRIVPCPGTIARLEKDTGQDSITDCGRLIDFAAGSGHKESFRLSKCPYLRIEYAPARGPTRFTLTTTVSLSHPAQFRNLKHHHF